MASSPDHEKEKIDDELFKRMFETLGVESPIKTNLDELLNLQKRIDDHLLWNVKSETDIKTIRSQIKMRKKEIDKMREDMRKLAAITEKTK